MRLKCLNMTGVRSSYKSSIYVNNVNARLNISYCVFYNNGNGGAIYLTNGATFEGEWNTFVGNKATDYGGAIFLNSGSVVSSTHSSFTGNSAGDQGGAICAIGNNAVPPLSLIHI